MKKFRIISSIIALLLVITSIPFVVFAEDGETDIKSEIPYCSAISGVSAYTGATLTPMTADEAAAEGVSGGEGHVLKLTCAKDGSSVTLDLAQIANEEVKLADVKSITARVYIVGSNVSNIRLTVKGTASWVKRENPSAYDEWIDFEIPVTSSLAYEDGETISPFCLAFRFSSNVATTVYIDHIKVEYNEPEPEPEPEPEVPDTEAPVIGWGEGIEVIYAAEGSVPLFNITATDNVDGEISTVLTWSEGAFDEAGRLSKGEHTLTITATDRAGNSSERSVFVFVNSDRPTVGHVVQDS